MVSVAPLGLKGVAQVIGVKVRGLPVWFLPRNHRNKISTLRRKVEVASDWTLALLFERDVTRL